MIKRMKIVLNFFPDQIKVWVFRVWNFKLTASLIPTPARKKKLADRQEDAIKHREVKASWHKVYKVVETYRVAHAFNRQTTTEA